VFLPQSLYAITPTTDIQQKRLGRVPSLSATENQQTSSSSFTSMKQIIISLTAAALAFVFMWQHSATPPPRWVLLPDPHDHPSDVSGVFFHLPYFVFVGVAEAAAVGMENGVVSQKGSYRAVVVETPADTDSPAQVRLLIEQRVPMRWFEVVGLAHTNAQITDVVWYNDSWLVFDQHPTAGLSAHYMVDVKRRKLLAAAPILPALPQREP
jgi:hypothetical protein